MNPRCHGKGCGAGRLPATAALSEVSGFATALPLASRASAAASPALDPLDRDRGLHSLLPPPAAFAADAGVACRSAHQSPLRRRHRRKRRSRRARACRSPQNSLHPANCRASAWSSRGRAIATPSTPRSRPRWRHSPCRQFSDDRRRRNRLAGLAGADGARRPRPPAPIWSAGRCCRISMTSRSAGCAAIRRFARPMTPAARCR